jgi:hypothetical protein
VSDVVSLFGDPIPDGKYRVEPYVEQVLCSLATMAPLIKHVAVATIESDGRVRVLFSRMPRSMGLFLAKNLEESTWNEPESPDPPDAA